MTAAVPAPISLRPQPAAVAVYKSVGILTRGVVDDGVTGVLVAIYVMIADGRQQTPLEGHNKQAD